MNKRTLNIIFYAFGIMSFIAMLYHIKGIFYPSALTPAWRHAVFIVINIIFLLGIIKRPSWFFGFVLILTIQQLYSHGSYAILLWQSEHKIHWVSIGIVILLPVLLWLLQIDRKIKSPTTS